MSLNNSQVTVQKERKGISNQPEIVVFRYKRPIEQPPEDQLIIQSKARKKPKPTTTYDNQQQQQDQLCKAFHQKLKLTNQQQKQKQKQATKQLFLTRIVVGEGKDIFGNEQQQSQRTVLGFQQKVEDYMIERRRQKRMEKFDKLRGVISEKDKNVKFIDLGRKNMIEFGNGEKFQYEDFSECLNPSKHQEEYYIMESRTQFKQGKCITLPEEAQKYAQNMEIDDAANEHPMSEQDSEDSNRESNPDYDYPQQQFHQDDSENNSSEGILYREQYPSDSDQENNMDEQQLFRNYRKRCMRKMSHDDSDVEYYQI